MKTIWKFTLAITDRQIVKLPKGSRLMSVADQGGQIVLWALVDPDAPTEERPFRIHGTGHPIPDDGALRFVGTVLMQGGALVWHVFLEPTDEERLRAQVNQVAIEKRMSQVRATIVAAFGEPEQPA